MTWKVKEKTIYDDIKTRFAFWPVRIQDDWVWLEKYYIFRTFNFLSCIEHEYRFRTKEEAEYVIREALYNDRNKK